MYTQIKVDFFASFGKHLYLCLMSDVGYIVAFQFLFNSFWLDFYLLFITNAIIICVFIYNLYI